jgi:hypothetical protein
MRAAYKYLAYAIPVLVMVQAAAIAWAVFGVSVWIDDGHSLTKSSMESNTFSFAEERGFMIHGINGQMLIPLIAIILLVVSFFAKVPSGAKWAGIILATVVLQVLLGMFAHGAPALGLLHGINAFVVAGLGVYAGRLASTRAADEPVQQATVTV